MGKWKGQGIKAELLTQGEKRGTDDTEGQFAGFIDLFGDFAAGFSQQDEDYRADFISRANELCDDYDLGDALADSSSDTLQDLGSSLLTEDKQKLLDFLREEGAIVE